MHVAAESHVMAIAADTIRRRISKLLSGLNSFLRQFFPVQVYVGITPLLLHSLSQWDHYVYTTIRHNYESRYIIIRILECVYNCMQFQHAFESIVV